MCIRDRRSNQIKFAIATLGCCAALFGAAIVFGCLGHRDSIQLASSATTAPSAPRPFPNCIEVHLRVRDVLENSCNVEYEFHNFCNEVVALVWLPPVDSAIHLNAPEDSYRIKSFTHRLCDEDVICALPPLKVAIMRPYKDTRAVEKYHVPEESFSVLFDVVHDLRADEISRLEGLRGSTTYGGISAWMCDKAQTLRINVDWSK